VAVLTIEPEPYDSPRAQLLIQRVQQEYVDRYGGPDATPVESQQFSPPSGLFLLGCVDGEPVACGAFRVMASGPAEFKRMYVDPRFRRQGHGRRLLAALEDAARRAGCHDAWLETGTRQPEAMALYAAAGYRPIAPFGHYAGAPESRCYGKAL
jgi:GNAT superfamily N-acetyltransferase